MEDKTLLEELLERSPDDRMHKKKMDRAYQLLSLGEVGEAGALFDEILAEEPYNQDALTGKKLIERQRAIERRMESMAQRARAALPEADAKKAPEKKCAEEAPPREPRPSLLRSKKVKTALIAVFALLVAAAAAFIVTDGFGRADAAPELQEQSVYLEAFF